MKIFQISSMRVCLQPLVSLIFLNLARTLLDQARQSGFLSWVVDPGELDFTQRKY